MDQTTELHTAKSADNGSASLSDRVRALRLPQETSQAPRNPVLPWGLCGVLLLTTTAFGYRAYRIGTLAPGQETPSAAVTSDSPSGEGRRARGEEESALASRPSSLAPEQEVVLQSKGYVIPAHQVQVSPKVGGMILWLHPRFEEGQFFQEGEVLARLEDDDYQAECARAEAAHAAAVDRWLELKNGSRPEEIEQAKYDLKEYEATLKQLKLDMIRCQRLVNTDSLAQGDFEKAKYAYDAMDRRVSRLRYALDLLIKGPREERIEAARRDVQTALADLEKASVRLADCEIKAPISGHILTKKAEKGNLVNPLAFTISGSLCDMADLGDLEIDLSIQERDIARVEKGQFCTIMPEAFQNHEPFRQFHPQGYQGKVARLMPIADRAKGAVSVRVKVEIPAEEVGKILKPDMSVLVSFHKGSK
jgi:HlyD family secretion protein